MKDSDSANETRAEYRYSLAIPTRWMDNDVYQHVNNVIYYSYFDTVVNEYLLSEKVLDYENGEVVGLVVETKCCYFSPLRFPDVVDACLRVVHIGNSSVRYEIGIFRKVDEKPAAAGHFIHVYVDRLSLQPTRLPATLRDVLTKIHVKR